MVIVSNISPIVNLAGIQRLHLLTALFGDIMIPDAVYDEIAIKGAGQPGATEVVTDSRFVRRSISEPQAVQALLQEYSGLNLGEAESIVLAHELSADLLLLDERLARNVAHARGIPFHGVLGVLLDAKRVGLIAQVAPVMAQLAHFGFFIDHTTYRDVQQQAGE